MTAEWQLREERRTYVGTSHEEAAAAAQEGMREALDKGYVAERVEWSGNELVTIEYLYDPARTVRSL